MTRLARVLSFLLAATGCGSAPTSPTVTPSDVAECTSSCAAAQSQPEMPSPSPSECDAPAGGLLGRVVIDGVPALRPVRVTVASSCTTFTEVTRAGGMFSLSSLPQGTYVLMASLGTEAAVVSEVTIGAGAVVAVDLELGADDVARAIAAMDRRAECGCSS